jgi:hypothetical protein
MDDNIVVDYKIINELRKENDAIVTNRLLVSHEQRKRKFR